MGVGLASKYMARCQCKKNGPTRDCGGDVFLAKVINQKSVTQNSQQALVLISAQVLGVVEAQFGFATNEEENNINA